MKFYFPEDFLVTTSKGYLEYEFGERTLLTARTRAAKTTGSCFFLASKKVEEPDSLCIIFGPNMTSFVADIKDKFEYFEHFQELGVRAVSYNHDEREQFMAEIAGVSSEPTILCVNSDYQHLDKIIAYLLAVKKRKIYAVIDEAHKGGAKTYTRLLTELKAPNIVRIETTATFRNRLLAAEPAKYVHVLVARNKYVKPSDATLIPFANNEWTYRNQLLHDEQLALIDEEMQNDQALVLINGYDKTAFHRSFKHQLKDYINSSDVAIITLNAGSAFWTTAEINSVEHQLYHKNGSAIRAASSAVAAIYELGFSHIVVIGQKQVAEGQTIGCSKITMTAQIIGTPISKQNADALVQSVRTGGLGILYPQKIMMPKERWKDYKTYVEKNEELAELFQDKTPEEQQALAEQAYLSLPTLKVSHGAYTPVTRYVDSDDVGSYYFELPLKSFGNMFEYGNKENTAALYTYIRSATKEQPWYTNQHLSAKKANGNPYNKIPGRGNDIQVHVNADPQSKEVKIHPLVFWKRDDKIAVRYIFKYEACKTHNYYGELESFSKTNTVVLELVSDSAA